ncbi:hypothetical protein ScPMuIL_014381 [Solemya velum]
MKGRDKRLSSLPFFLSAFVEFCTFEYDVYSGYKVLLEFFNYRIIVLSLISDNFNDLNTSSASLPMEYSKVFTCTSPSFPPRQNNSLLPAATVVQPLATLDDGHWTLPYFDCGGGDIWMVTYSSPILGIDDITGVPVFKGVATIDIELTNIDINQCDPTGESTGALGVFGGTHVCSPSTKCVHNPGQGFRRGAYQCICDEGYYFPDPSSKQKAYSGFDIEETYNTNDSTEAVNFRCIYCAPGCDTCVDDSPCLYSINMALRLVVLALAIIQLVAVIVISVVTHIYRAEVAIKSGSPIFLQIMCVGSVVMVTEMFIIFPEPTDVLCAITPWIHHTGFNLMYGALILKTWRISIIFRVGKVKRVRLPDQVLAQRLLPILGVTMAILAAWTAADPPYVETLRTGSDLKFFNCTESWWSYAIYGAETLMLLFGVYLCFTVRKAPAQFNESKHITWSTYNAIILGTFLTIVSRFIAQSSGPDVLYVLQFLELQVFVTITFCLIFGPKFWVLKTKRDMHEADNAPINTITSRFKRQPSCQVETLVNIAATRSIGVQVSILTPPAPQVKQHLSIPQIGCNNKVGPLSNEIVTGELGT